MWSFVIYPLLFATSICFAAQPTAFDTLVNGVKNDATIEIAQKYQVFPLLKAVKLDNTATAQVGPPPIVLGFKPPLDIPQARIMILDAVDIYLKNLNQNPALQSYIPQFPVENNNVEIVGILFDPTIRVPPNDILWSFALLDGVIQYYVFDRDVGKRTVQQETVQEARALLGKEPITNKDGAVVQWDPLPGSQYATSIQELKKQLDNLLTAAKANSITTLQLCAKDASLLPAIVLSRMSQEDREHIQLLTFTPIPFVSATVCKGVCNCLMGTGGYIPLLDINQALDYIQEGISLNKNSITPSKLVWDVEAPIYQSMLQAETSKQQDGIKVVK